MSGSATAGEAFTGTRVTVSAAGEVRVMEGAADLLPMLLEGSYFTPTTKIYLVGELSGEHVRIEPSGESTGAPFIVDWPSGCADPMLELRIADPERATAGVSIPPVTIWAPGAVLQRASRLTWSAPSEHGLFHVKLVTADARRFTVDHRLVLSPSYTASWDWLAFGTEYRAIVRAHDGRGYAGHVCELMLSAYAAALPSDVTDASDAIDDLRMMLTSGDARRRVPPSVLRVDRRADTPEMAQVLCRVLFDALEGPNGVHRRRAALNFRAIEALAQSVADHPHGSVHMRDLLEYLALYGVVDRYFIEQGFDNRHIERVFSVYDFFTRHHADALLNRLRQSPAYREGSFSALMLDGFVLSTFDRDAAAESFELARSANPDMWALDSDRGAASYMTRRYVEQRAFELSPYKQRLKDSLSFVTAMPRWEPGEYMYVCPCDRMFFRIYFPFWLATADYLKPKRISFHFLLYSAPDEAAELIEAAGSLSRRLGSLRGEDPRTYADNISFSAVPIPDDVVDPSGFYVCARFLLARQLGSEYQGPVLMHDMDMFFREDPRPYLEALDPDRITIQLGDPNLATLKPWRRFLGGTLVVPFSQRAHEGLAHLEDYLTAGLPLERWVTDQNALTYFVERAIEAGEREALIAGLAGPSQGQPSRPTEGERIRKVFEPVQRGREEEAG